MVHHSSQIHKYLPLTSPIIPPSSLKATDQENTTTTTNKKEQMRSRRRRSFRLNDNVDVLAEVLARLDGRSLGVAACVCRLWSAMCRREAVWERACNWGEVGEEERSVVVKLGGYRRFYKVCVGPVLERMGRRGRRWGREEVQLSLSLFSVDLYEQRLGLGKRTSLMFLCKAR